MSDGEPQGIAVTLGERTYYIVPQPIGRIRRKLVKIMALAEGVGGGNLDSGLDEDLYSVFKTFIPDLAPLYELMGYASEDAYSRGEEPEDESYDKRSPTVPQIIGAVEHIYTVNGADRLVRLGKGLVGADAIRHRLRKAVISWEPSASSPVPSGGSDSTPSTPSEEAPEALEELESEASPSPDSSTSTRPETAVA